MCENIIQLNIEFGISNDNKLQFNWKSLSELLQRQVDQADVNWFFFQRKPPGLRLRVSTLSDQLELIFTFVDWLENAKSKRWISGYTFQSYEPEYLKFGGEIGILLAHRSSFFDSQATLSAINFEANLKYDNFLESFSIHYIDNYLLRACEDLSEIEEVWNLVGNEIALAPVDLHEHAASDIRSEPIRLRRDKTAKDFVVGLFEISSSLGRDFCKVRKTGLIAVPPRRWLSQFVIYHFNRLGFDARAMQVIVEHRLRRGFQKDLI